MKSLLLLTLAPLGGCSAYIDAQIALTEQARKGVALVADAQAGCAARAEQVLDLRRRQLDEAFDADVRHHPSPDTAWIIEHRRAYAAAVDTLHRARLEQSKSDAATTENLKSIDLALQRLIWLQSLSLRWLSLPEVLR